MKKFCQYFLPLFYLLSLPISSQAQIIPSKQYGELFQAVQMSGIFEDSKTFPDMIALHPLETIMERYKSARNNSDFDLEAFVLDNFKYPPSRQTDFKSDTQRSVEEHIKRLWPVLTRQPDKAQQSSLIPLPHPYVVPGGRFREIYYWDSYFTILGLRQSRKTDLIKNMVDNFSFLIDSYGFIPNGNRTYYLSRSQPPFFPLMVQVLSQAKVDPQVLVHFLPQLQREYNFWMQGSDSLHEANTAARNVVQLADNTVLNRYWDSSTSPRPEAFREDSLLAAQSDRKPKELYRDLRAAAESGWDFSSRWLAKGKSLASIHTTDIVPVDLNSLLYHYEQILSRAYGLKGNTEKEGAYQEKAARRKTGILKYCWDPDLHIFTDYNYRQQSMTGIISAAAMYPLFFNIATKEQARQTAETVQRKIIEPGGIATTTNETGQQWDKPNGWAPLQWIAYKGLKNYGLDSLAGVIRDRWLELNRRVYHNTGKMMEKYNVSDTEVEAGGGEYPLQDGFGWTNGVYLQFKATLE